MDEKKINALKDFDLNLQARQDEANNRRQKTLDELRASLTYGFSYLEAGFLAEAYEKNLTTCRGFLDRVLAGRTTEKEAVEILLCEVTGISNDLLSSQPWEHRSTDELTNLTYGWKVKASQSQLALLVELLQLIEPEAGNYFRSVVNCGRVRLQEKK